MTYDEWYLRVCGMIVTSACVAPNVHSHRSAFSFPFMSYQALPSGSVTASSNSWATKDHRVGSRVIVWGGILHPTGIKTLVRVAHKGDLDVEGVSREVRVDNGRVAVPCAID